ncbi:MAG: exosortase A [Gammaproteobacteria bacterium]|nr:exosortase A [Gammaproteobacteria bacterium]
MVSEQATQLDQSRMALTSEWKRAALIACISILGICLLFNDTVRSMTVIWRSEPYTYGFLVCPISIWLIWNKRRQLALLTPRPEFRVLVLMFLAGAVWLLAHLVFFQFLQQVALISLLILTVWCILGKQVTKALAFPLGFLLFAAPPLFVIEPLYPTMVEFTADFVVRLLHLTGIPVYREGIYLTVPNGLWSVEEQCSGVQYLTSSVIIGCVYAYNYYRSFPRRLLVLVSAIVIPIIANGFRAYIIIIIGYLSDMKLAVGLDHLVYGWLFYFIIIYLMFLIGSFWWETSSRTSDAGKLGEGNGNAGSISHKPMQFIGAGMASLLAASIWPGIAVPLDRVELPYQELKLKAPVGVDGWRGELNRYWRWSPRVRQVDGELHAFYRQGNQAVSLYLAQFRGQRRDADPFGRPNVWIVPEAHSWRNDIRSPKKVSMDGGHLKVLHAKTVTIMRGEQWGDLLIWYWYRIGNRHVTSPFHAKLLDAWALLTGGKREIALVALATTYDGDLKASESVLQSFASSMTGKISTMLDRTIIEGK